MEKENTVPTFPLYPSHFAKSTQVSLFIFVAKMIDFEKMGRLTTGIDRTRKGIPILEYKDIPDARDASPIERKLMDFMLA